MRRIICALFCLIIILSLSFSVNAETINAVVETEKETLGISAKSCLLMEASTGTVLYGENETEPLPPASVTKIMSLLLIMEAIENGTISLDDIVTTSEYAASMGGTQLYLEVGEQMSVNDLIKAITIPSANDATVAMAEFVAGTEQEFVYRMNEKSVALGLKNTHFTSCTGLFDDNNHYTCAYDIAVIAQELIKHQLIFNYSTVWMDSVRDGKFGLTNTNKMLRSYVGMTGLKTGYTRLSGYCFCGTATRDGMTLIAVVLGETDSKTRFADSASLLNYGFSGYEIVSKTPSVSLTLPAEKAKNKTYQLSVDGDVSLLVQKGLAGKIEETIDIPDCLTAPLKSGTVIGKLTYKVGDKEVKSFDVYVTEDVERAGIFDYLGQILSVLIR